LKESRVRVRASFWAHPQQDYQRFPWRLHMRPRSGGG
jgi:hypothetical protein